jgi:hypothetical protein
LADTLRVRKAAYYFFLPIWARDFKGAEGRTSDPAGGRVAQGFSILQQAAAISY